MKGIRTILLVEDDENDVILIQRALRKGEIDAPIHVIWDGDKAIEYLSGTGRYQDVVPWPLPMVVLLDLRLPGRSGLEVLAWLDNHKSLALLPVVVFTNSTQDIDVSQAFALGANSYLKKPYTLAATTALLKTVAAYWLDHNVRSPKLKRPA